MWQQRYGWVGAGEGGGHPKVGTRGPLRNRVKGFYRFFAGFFFAGAAPFAAAGWSLCSGIFASVMICV